MKKNKASNLQNILKEKTVINIGIDLFIETLNQQDVKVIKVDFKPPTKYSGDLANILDIVSGGEND